MRIFYSSNAEAPATKKAEGPATVEEDSVSDSGTGDSADILEQKNDPEATSATQGMVVAIQTLEQLMDPRSPA